MPIRWDTSDREFIVSCTELSNVLFRGRQLLELLLFKVVEEQVLLAAGQARWLPHATREVEAVLRELSAHELDRAVTSAATARDLGLAPDATLRELASVAPKPWDQIFGAHREELERLAHEIAAVADNNREMLGRGEQATREAIEFLGMPPEPSVETYSNRGTAMSASTRSGRATIVDREI